ncbi:MAG TPA: glycosyltransferase [Solirubrobacteraceae bacterium]|nr:glycosyltransferase [Solirubrobacteraceae bacterium]
MSSSPAEQGAPALRVAVVGVSTDPLTCGVRDHATLLARALEAHGVSSSLHWLSREERTLAGSRRELDAFAHELGSALAASPPDAVLLHYSAFTFSFRGVPLFVPAVLSGVRRSRAPLVTVLHEYAYPWGRAGLRGTVWAITQRAFLLELARASAALVVTADFRASELAARRWLPRRRIEVAPVFSNLPEPRRGGADTAQQTAAVGLFGYASEGTSVEVALDALRLLREQGRAVELRLLGAPGADSEGGRAWCAAAAARGVDAALSFTGWVSAQELADALAACDGLLFADSSGPTSRKTTLAASLASGSPLVAIDGPRRWQALADAEAARIVAPTAQALADGIGALLEDEAERARLGERGRAFAQREMSVERAAQVLAQLLRAIA